jgi:hypothetical protein
MGRLWARFKELRRDESVSHSVAGVYESWMRSLHKTLRVALQGRAVAPDFIAEFNRQHEEIRRRLRALRSAQWQQLLAKQLSGDAGLLHRITQDIGIQAYAQEQGPGGVMSSSTAQQLASDHVRWSKQWPCSEASAVI